jgi:hypothetical protein
MDVRQKFSRRARGFCRPKRGETRRRINDGNAAAIRDRRHHVTQYFAF